ncbi:MAG: hypothetical protein ACK41T_07780 [Pseudobdellovibrio sp.]
MNNELSKWINQFVVDTKDIESFDLVPQKYKCKVPKELKIEDIVVYLTQHNLLEDEICFSELSINNLQNKKINIYVQVQDIGYVSFILMHDEQYTYKDKIEFHTELADAVRYKYSHILLRVGFIPVDSIYRKNDKQLVSSLFQINMPSLERFNLTSSEEYRNNPFIHLNLDDSDRSKIEHLTHLENKKIIKKLLHKERIAIFLKSLITLNKNNFFLKYKTNISLNVKEIIEFILHTSTESKYIDTLKDTLSTDRAVDVFLLKIPSGYITFKTRKNPDNSSIIESYAKTEHATIQSALEYKFSHIFFDLQYISEDSCYLTDERFKPSIFEMFNARWRETDPSKAV